MVSFFIHQIPNKFYYSVFDFMSGKSKSPKIITIKKLCAGANITLEQFFAKDYFNDVDEIYN